MKKNIMLFVLLLMIFSCRKKCTEGASTKSSLDATLDAYFGVYKKGNYRVYENQDKTKKDSIYVLLYSRYSKLESPPCSFNEELNTTLISSGKNFFNSNGDTAYIKASFKSIYSNYYSIFPNTIDGLYFESDTVLATSYTGKASHLLAKKINDSMYSDVLQVYNLSDTLYIQKNVGIIGWKKNNDTYNLVNKYLQP